MSRRGQEPFLKTAAGKPAWHAAAEDGNSSTKAFLLTGKGQGPKRGHGKRGHGHHQGPLLHVHSDEELWSILERPFQCKCPINKIQHHPNKPGNIQVALRKAQLQEDGYGFCIVFLEVWRGTLRVKKTQLCIFPLHFILPFKSEIKGKNEKSVGIQTVMPKHKRKPKCWTLMKSGYEEALDVLLDHCV